MYIYTHTQTAPARKLQGVGCAEASCDLQVAGWIIHEMSFVTAVISSNMFVTVFRIFYLICLVSQNWFPIP